MYLIGERGRQTNCINILSPVFFADDDDDCDHGLICYHRDEKESVPECSGGSSANSSKPFVFVEE